MAQRSTRTIVPLMCLALVAVSGCTADSSDGPDGAPGDVPVARQDVVDTVPQTPFCAAMTGLASRLETDTSTPAAPLILDTYREVIDVAPEVLVDDLRTVIDAIADGRPIPTDPPVSVATVPPTTDPGVASVASVAPAPTAPAAAPPATPSSVPRDVTSAAPAPDLDFNEATSPTERIANYVGFECRGTDNNPGPPATEPLSAPVTTGG